VRGGAPCSNRAQLSAPACAVPHAVVILTPVKRARHLVVAACRSRVRAIELWARTYGTLVARRRAAIACNHIVCLGTGGGAHFGRCEYGNERVPWKVGVSKTEKRAVFNYLLREGVITVRKDSYLPKHQHLDQIPNLKVQMLVKSLKSKGYLNEVFSWNWSYYTLTNAGVAYLVKTLGVSADVVPLTFKKKRVVAAPKADDEGDEKPAAEEVAEAKE